MPWTVTRLIRSSILYKWFRVHFILVDLLTIESCYFFFFFLSLFFPVIENFPAHPCMCCCFNTSLKQRPFWSTIIAKTTIIAKVFRQVKEGENVLLGFIQQRLTDGLKKNHIYSTPSFLFLSLWEARSGWLLWGWHTALACRQGCPVTPAAGRKGINGRHRRKQSF